MKKIKLFKTLLVLGVLMTSINTAKAGTGYTFNRPYIVYYNDAGWSQCMALYGREWDNEYGGYTPGHYTKSWNLALVGNTEKLYYALIDDYWDDSFNQIAILEAKDWGDARDKIGNRWNGGDGRTNHTDYIISNYSFDKWNTYYWGGHSASSVSHCPSGASDVPHPTTTLNIKVKESGAAVYSNGSTSDKPAETIKLRGSYINDDNRSSAVRSDAEWSTGYSCSYNVVISGIVTPSYSDLDDAWQFDGWYIGDTRKSTAESFDYYQTEATTVEARFTRINYTVNFNQEGGSGGTSSVTATYGSSMPSITVPTSARSGYTFDGYYSGEGGSGTKYYNADGSSARNSDLADPSGTTLYAKWVQTVTLNDNHGGSNNGSVSAIYKGIMGTPSAPTYTDHTLDLGYYAESSCTNKVMNLDGTLVASVTISKTDWTNSSSKWIHAGPSVLFAHWKVNAPAVSCTDNVVTMSVPTGSTVYYTTDGSTTPTSSSTAYDPSNKPTIAANTTIKAIAIQAGCTNSNVTTQAVTYTQEYDVNTTLTNVTKSSGATTVLEDHTYEAVFAGSTGYNLPDAITVKFGSTTKEAETDYTWTKATGTVSIPEDKIKDDVTIIITGVAQEYSITYKDKDNADFSGVHEDGYPTSHTYGSATALDSPTKTGYVFEGWHTESDCESGKVTSLGATTYTADITLYAKWESAAEVVKDCWTEISEGVYKWDCEELEGIDTPKPDATSWDAAESWGAEEVPNINTQVVLTKSMSITGDAIAKEVILPSDKKLDIAAGGSLIVANTVQLSNGSAPSSSNIEISSSLSNGNAALIWGADATISADVEFTTRSHGSAGSSASVNQYIGVPTETSVWSYTDSWLFEVRYDGDGNPYWSYMDGGTLEPWKGYSLISMSGSAGSGYTISGELTNEDHEYSGSDLHYNSSDPEGTENLLANSWTAPIRISAFDAEEDFNDVDATIYIFNSNSKDGFDRENPKGNYASFTPGEETTDVIPSMQSFSVMTKGASPRVSLHYKQLVYEPATKGFNNHANYAPKHSQESEEKKSLKLYVQGTDGWADLLKVYERSDYSPEFENGRDAHKLQGNAAAPHLYGVCSDGELAINFVPTVDNMVVGFHAGTASKEYTFSFNYDGDDELVLKDTKTEIETPIDNESTYNFTSSPEDNDLRFVVIKKTPQVVTGVESVSENSNVQKIMHNGAMYIVRDGKIYSVDGSLVK